MQDELVEVTLELQTPDVIPVKSLIGDGTKAIELYYTAFLNGLIHLFVHLRAPDEGDAHHAAYG